jgi:CAAX protease family protein
MQAGFRKPSSLLDSGTLIVSSRTMQCPRTEDLMSSSGSQVERWPVLARVFLFMLGCALVLIIISSFGSNLPQQWFPAIVGLAASIATMILTLIFIRWDRIQLADIGASPRRNSILRLLLGFAAGFLLVAAQTCLFTLAEHARWIRSNAPVATPIMIALVTYLLLACREELAFHGYPLRRLNRLFGPVTAQSAVALVFALEHRAGGYSWTSAFFGAFLGSLLFGMAALATRGLAVPIGLHAAWNFGQWMIGEKESPGLWRAIVPAGPSANADHFALLAYVMVFSSVTVAMWWLGKRHGRE